MVVFLWKHTFRCFLNSFCCCYFLLGKNTKKEKENKTIVTTLRMSYYHWEWGRLHKKSARFGGIWSRLDGVIRHIEKFSVASDVTRYLDVAIVSPHHAPRVLYYPIIYTFFCSVFNDCNTVIWTWKVEITKKNLKSLR